MLLVAAISMNNSAAASCCFVVDMLAAAFAHSVTLRSVVGKLEIVYNLQASLLWFRVDCRSSNLLVTNVQCIRLINVSCRLHCGLENH
jgi:hypothetical protein